MITDINKLRSLCLHELEQRSYSEAHKMRLSKAWDRLEKWLKERSIDVFDVEVAKRYCNETLGSYLLLPNWSYRTRLSLRAVRMLVTFQQRGDFEFRSPKSDHSLTGPLAAIGNEFLDHCQVDLKSSKSTIYSKRFHLHMLCRYLGAKEGLPKSLSVDDIDAFLKSDAVSKGGIGEYCRTIKQFLRFLSDRGYLERDLSALIPSVPKRRFNSLPTTYTEEEITKLLSVVETSSPIGKRDRLILLLASEYGLRASDIRTLEFGDIDWDRSAIVHRMKKTGEFVELPLVPRVGNAIIDYLGEKVRPKSDSKCIVVSHNLETRGRPLTSPTLHSVVAKYMKAAGIKDWQKKRHGPHSLRHSLAVRLLSKNTSTPVISEVLGHQSTASTSVYLKVDIPKLMQCPLPMPPIDSPYYSPEGGHGKI